MKYPFQVLYFSSYPPRECGIATFTRDLTTAMDKRFNPSLKSSVLAINDNGSSIYNYGKDVINQLDESDMEHYIDKAKEINQNENIKLVCIQHEFGLFGGEYGDYIIPFLETLTKPVVVNFHSVLPNPDEQRKKVVRAIAKRCSSILVMVETGKRILHEQYEVEKAKIRVIPHGVPTIEKISTDIIKEELGLKNRIILSTFGLLSRGKGIEYVIRALPDIVSKYPDFLYLIIGETHPQVRKHEGERYRLRLIRLVKKLGLRNHVKFYNKYLTLKEIIKYLQATDIYINSTLDPDQITSGTVSYALGAGKAIISTPSLYSKEVLSNRHGILVPFKTPKSITDAILNLLSNPELKKEIENNSYLYGQKMIWPNVANSYLKVYKNIVDISENVGLKKLPNIKLDHLKNLTDDVGIVQHSKFSVKDSSTGYTLDDNSRALIVISKYNELFNDKLSKDLINKYLSLIYFTQKRKGTFHNLVSYRKKFLDRKGSEDSFGRAVWATGTLIANNNIYENVRALAKEIFNKAKDIKLKSPRSKAFYILGLYEYYKKYKETWILEKIKQFANDLIQLYQDESSKDWNWFEKRITYSNGRLCEALFLAYDLLKDKKYLKVAEESLNFLTEIVIKEDRLILVGHNGWFNQNGKRAYFDQQPVDASSMVDVYLVAHKITNNKEYYHDALLSFNWFLGRNLLNRPVYDEVTGGCFDGLGEGYINLNQGAESTLAYLMSRLNLELYNKSN
ncbi:glycosyltransferase [Candidatus Woesearchaeota archaeon]|nr:glycosyltransferase [Candidatus Woesearchaeota archaeon]